MAINQQTAAIKARMDRIPSALSPELVERIAADRASGVVNPYRCNDGQVIRRVDRAADQARSCVRPLCAMPKRFSICLRTPDTPAKLRFSAFAATMICRVVACTCNLFRASHVISVAPWGSTAI